MKSTLLFFLLGLGCIYPQADTTFNFDLFNVKLSNNAMQVLNPANKVVFEKIFSNPTAYTSDLDADGNDELLISDYLETLTKKDYILYVYSAADSFSECGVIHSGYVEPYVSYSDEIQKNIIISGDSSLNYLNNDTEISYPLICREYDDGFFSIVNDDLYDLFISENDNIIEFLDNYFKGSTKDCESDNKVKNVIASGYVNYLSAGESTMANHFLNNYYFCSDSLEFRQALDNIINKDQ